MLQRMSFQAQLDVRTRVEAAKLCFDSVNEWLTSSKDRTAVPHKLDLEKILSLKEDGNAFVRMQQWTSAKDRYTTALEMLDGVHGHGDLRHTLFLNRALCGLKMARYNACVKDCERALTWKPSAKGLFRKACAETELQRWAQARADLDACAKLLGDDADTLRQVRDQQEMIDIAEANSREKSLEFARRAMCTRVPEWCRSDTDESLRILGIEGISSPTEPEPVTLSPAAQPYIPRSVRLRTSPPNIS
jgi:tetratricopeptide (TPR) repeat protein